MKKIFSIVFLLAIQATAFSQVPSNVTTDNNKLKPTDVSSNTSTSATSAVNGKTGPTTTVNRDTSHQTASTQPDKKENCKCDSPPRDAGLGGWILTLSPLFIFLFLFFFMLPKLKDFDFKQALAESEYPTITIKNELLTPENLQRLKQSDANINIQSLLNTLPPTVEISNPEKEPKPLASISRYMGFVSIVLTLIVALCTSSFFIYHYITRGCTPDLSSLSIVLIALTIGIAPYAVNKITAAASSHKED